MDRYANKQNMAELSKAIHDKYSPTATTSSAGLMSASDKEKLDGIDVGANDYALPLMSPTTRGGAKLDEHGGLVLRNEKLGIGSLVQESDGTVRGGIAELTAKGHAEQDGTPTPESPVEIQVVRGRNLLSNTATSQTIKGVTFTVNADGSVTCNGTATAQANFSVATKTSLTLVAGQAYTLTGTPSGGSYSTYFMKATDDITDTYFEYGSGVTFTPTDTFVTNYYKVQISVISGTTVSNLTFYPQLTLGSTSQPYVPYGHVGMEAKGKNLLPMMQSETISGITATVADDGTITLNGTATATTLFYCQCNIAPGTYTLSANNPTATSAGTVVFKLVDAATADMPGGSKQINNAYTVVGITIQATASKYVIRIGGGSTLSNYTMRLQLELGTEATEYEPHYHTTTPIPLPSRGWAAGLPDGTADTLTLDGAGKVTWEEETSEVMLDGSESGWMSSSVANVYYRLLGGKTRTTATLLLSSLCNSFSLTTKSRPNMTDGQYEYEESLSGQYAYFKHAASADLAAFKAWLQSNPITVLYPLATPIIEECGYVDMPTDIPEGATVTISELDSVGIKYFIDSSVTELAKQWYAKSRSEYEDRLASLEDAVAQLIAEG